MPHSAAKATNNSTQDNFYERRTESHLCRIQPEQIRQSQKFEGVEGGLASHRELFLKRSVQLRGLQIHTIFTVPLRLVRSSDGPQLSQRYGLRIADGQSAQTPVSERAA
ncbi:MAG TPA: hypothetical protein PLQ88_11615 [Blastocatellia bacterium]|nr:hypothetical protein [Blastocatellia bacterium]HMY72471.1 hypothetical protein [Blastocatellia bacterium]